MTVLSKSFHGGWLAESEVALFDGKVLRVSTMKRYNGKLVSVAQAMQVKDGYVSFVMYQDFNVSLESSAPKRVTEKTVREQHSRVMANIAGAVATAKQFYGKV
jgi:hypothetical protein